MISNRLGILSSLVGMLAGLALLLGLGPVVYPPLAMASGSSIVPGLSVLAFSGVFLFAGWQERDNNWRFGITDRRLLLVRGNKLFRNALPGELRRVRIKGMTVTIQRCLAEPAETGSGLSPVHPTPYLTLPKRGADSRWRGGRILEVCGEILLE